MKRLLAITVLLTAVIAAGRAQCPDFTDLNGPGVTCQYGNYYNPFQFQGIAVNRHTVITQQGADPNTDYHLPFLPPDENAVIRLGNSNTGAEAEAITYQFTVDPDNPLLLVKFAVVMEDPDHGFPNQPRFVMRVVDAAGNLVNSCAEYDVHAGADIPGFNSTGIVRWRPWTNVGLDLTEFAGQSIRVQFITYDCAYYGHYGYAYFTASCISNNLVLSGCDGDSVTLSAPPGFPSYEWSNGDTNSSTVYPQVPSTASCHITSATGCEFTLLGTLLETVVPSESAVFYDTVCEDQPYHNHMFDLLPPHQVGTNIFKQVFYNSSDCSGGSVTYTLHLTVLQKYNHIYDMTCEGFDYDNHGFHYTDLPSGLLLDTLVVSLPLCDSVYYILHLTVSPSFSPTTAISGNLSVCDGDVNLYSVAPGNDCLYQWQFPDGVYSMNGTQSNEIAAYFTSQAPNPSILQLTGSNGCGSGTIQITVEHNPSYHFLMKDTICTGEMYMDNGFNVPLQDSMGYYTFTRHLTTQQGCDSVMVLQLLVSQTPSLQTLAQPIEICMGQSTTIHALGEGAGFETIPAVEPEVEVGDIWCTDYSFVKPENWPCGKTAKGIVFYVDTTGQHGWAVSLEDLTGGSWFNGAMYWCEGNYVLFGSTTYATIREAIYDTNGLATTFLLNQHNSQYQYSPCIKISASDIAAGWYVPTLRQLYILFYVKGLVNTSLQLVGTTLYNYVDESSTYYWSSTEASSQRVWCLRYNGSASTRLHMSGARVRLICNF